MDKLDFEKQMQEQIEERLTAMEREGYPFPRRFSKRDYWTACAVVLFCLAMIIGGAYV